MFNWFLVVLKLEMLTYKLKLTQYHNIKTSNQFKTSETSKFKWLFFGFQFPSFHQNVDTLCHQQSGGTNRKVEGTGKDYQYKYFYWYGRRISLDKICINKIVCIDGLWRYICSGFSTALKSVKYMDCGSILVQSFVERAQVLPWTRGRSHLHFIGTLFIPTCSRWPCAKTKYDVSRLESRKSKQILISGLSRTEFMTMTTEICT